MTPGSKADPAFITTPSHKMACFSTQPSSIVTLFQIYEPSIETFEPILHPSPITEFETLPLLPIVVPLPTRVKGPILAFPDKPISVGKKKEMHMIPECKMTLMNAN